MKTKYRLVAAAAWTILLCLFAPVSQVAAVNVFNNNPGCATNNGATICSDSDGRGLFTVIKSVINIMLIVAGVIAVIMIIVGGIRYSTSGGDQAQVKSAKDTVLYSVIGLVIAVMSYGIVNFVVDKL